MDDADLQAYLASSSDEEGTKITPFSNPVWRSEVISRYLIYLA